jgi:nucleotide-binding universal stress UspA family protein
MYKDLLVVLTDTGGDAAALEMAGLLGEQLQTHVAALVPVSLFTPLGFEWGALPGDFVARMHDAERERAQTLAERVRAWNAAHAAAPMELRVAESSFLTRSGLATVHARHADLTLVATGGDDASKGLTESMFLDLLMDSGGPVMAIPPQHRAVRPLRRAVVAWSPRREASRAVRDALPILRSIPRVDVLVVDPKVGDDRYGPQPGADIAAHLARHGLEVQLVAEPDRGEPTEIAVLRHVVESGADLVIAGGYGHSRFREQVLGGVTKTLLNHSPVPVLFSH